MLKARVALLLSAVMAVAVPTLAVAATSSDNQGTRTAATVAAAPVCVPFLATNTAGQTRVLTSNDPRLSTNTVYANLPCGTTTVSVPRGRRALAVVKVDAEVTCTGTTPAVASQWCLARVLIGGVEGQPNAPEPDSFAWAQSSPDSAAWESAAFTRTRTLACPRTFPRPTCGYFVTVQVRNHAPGLLLRVDDSTVHADLRYF